MSKFILVKHDAKERGIHYDLRFEIPKSTKWASFATTKNSSEKLPPKDNKKITLIRTNDHTKKEATFTGTIEKGYGKGKLTEEDSGNCNIEKYTNSHIVIDFKGKKLKGKYHLVNTNKFSNNKKDNNIYLFFKAKNKMEEK